MKDAVLDKFIRERIRENSKLFLKEELECIKHNKNCIIKIYLLACKNAKESYENNKINN